MAANFVAPHVGYLVNNVHLNAAFVVCHLLGANLNREMGHRGALDVFYSFGILPRREDPVDCPICDDRMRTRTGMLQLGWRMITVSLGTNTLILSDGSPHILDICVFDKELPKVIEAFSKKYFL